MARCGVCIGVNHVGQLEPLQSAASGALAVARLLNQDGYDVTSLVDEPVLGGQVTPVYGHAIVDAVRTYVKAHVTKGYDLMVIYFSGHGYWKNNSQLWLLSGAPDNPNEAVSLLETEDLAQNCRIPNVVLITDACRQLSKTNQHDAIRGVVLFPNSGGEAGQSDVDSLMAAKRGRAAYEVKLPSSGAVESVFTHCLLNAYHRPDDGMVVEVKGSDGAPFKVVPNRKLRDFLEREVPKLLGSVSPANVQIPELKINCRDHIYIARLRSAPMGPVFRATDIGEAGAIQHSSFNRVRSVKAAQAYFQRRASFLARLAGLRTSLIRSMPPIKGPMERDFVQMEKRLGSNPFSPVFRAGFTVSGGKVVDVCLVGNDGGSARVLDSGGHRRLGRIGIDPGARRAATALVCFDNGCSVPVAAMAGYAGHVVMGPQGVRNVSYRPIARGGIAQQGMAEVTRMRAYTAQGIWDGTFAVEPRFERVLLRGALTYDPALVLYQMYAYRGEGGREASAQLMRETAEQLGVQLFDVQLLGEPQVTQSQLSAAVPFCPMLTQGWNFLRSRNAELSRILWEAQNQLMPAPWTAFNPRWTGLLWRALKCGDLE